METVTHQPRERSVPCSRCRRDTWETSAICLDCQTPVDDSCPRCHGDGVIEIYAHPLSAEQTKQIKCPRCSSGLPVRSNW